VALAEPPSVTVTRRGQVAFAGRDADRTVVWLRGKHDRSTLDAVSDALDRAMALDNADLVVDLSQVQLMSEAIVDAIVRARELLRERSRSLALRSPSPSTRRAFDLRGLGDLLGVAADGSHQVEGGSTNVAGRKGP
jgi:anti-anti-sigma factor